MEKYFVEQIDDFFYAFANNDNQDFNRLMIPNRMIKIPLKKGDLVEIERTDRGYQIRAI